MSVFAGKLKWLLMLAVVLLALVGWSYIQVSPGEGRILRVGMYDNPPKIYRDAQHRPAGLFVELLQAIAQDEGWQLQFVDCQWNDCLHRLHTGDIDLMPDVALNQERARRFDFHSIPVTYSWSNIWVRPDQQVTGLPELDGLRIAVLRGAVQQQALATMMRGYQLHYTEVLTDSLAAGFEAVLKDKADAVVSNKHFAEMNRMRYGLRETPIVFNPASLYYAVAKGHNRDLLKIIDTYLAAWRQDGDSPYYAALKNAMVPLPQPSVPVVWRWVLGLCAAAVLLLTVISALLRWQLRLGTEQLRRINTRYNHLLKTSPVVLYQMEIDEQGARPLWVSENMSRLFGYKPKRVYRPDWWLKTVHPADRSAAQAGFELLKQRSHLVHEYRILDAEGKVRRIRDEMQYIEGKHGQPAEIVGSWSDLTGIRDS